MSSAVWQISGGPASRAYAEVFLRHGVALIGPGDAGSWNPERDDDELEGGFVRRFASEAAVGDAFLLRTSPATIAAVGLAAGDYVYVNAFDDVNGWDLQHARRVRWCRLPVEHAFAGAVFGANPPRCSRVWNEEVADFAERFLKSPPTHWQTAPLPELPAEEPPLDQVPAAKDYNTHVEFLTLFDRTANENALHLSLPSMRRRVDRASRFVSMQEGIHKANDISLYSLVRAAGNKSGDPHRPEAIVRCEITP
jgi:hypothetical protein